MYIDHHVYGILLAIVGQSKWLFVFYGEFEEVRGWAILINVRASFTINYE